MTAAKKKNGPSTSSGRVGLEFGSAIAATLQNHARKCAPNECCGILLGHGSTITTALPAANVHPDPQTHFEVDPQALVDAQRRARAGGAQVLGYYHSHPRGPARPSPTDEAHASGDGRIWAIIGMQGELSLWKDAKAGFFQLSYEVSET